MNRGTLGISNESTDTYLGSEVGRPGIVSGNCLLGFQAGRAIQGTQIGGTLVGQGSGSFNTFIGYQAGQNVTTADSIVAVGYQAGQSAAGGAVAIGYQAVASSTSSPCTAVGYQATAVHQSSTIIGALANSQGTVCVAVGVAAGCGTNGVAVGASSFASSQDVVVGVGAGKNGMGLNSVVVGYQAGSSMTSGGAAGNLVFVGYQSGVTGTSANASTSALGQTCIGYQTGQASTSQVNYITCLGYQTLCGAAGAVAIGTDSGGVGASTSVANEIKLGTANHTTTILGLSKLAAHAKTAGALSTVTLVTATGTQIDTTSDRFTVTSVTYNPTGIATATALVELSPDNTTYSTLATVTAPALAALSGLVDIIDVVVPAGWYLRLTVTNATIGVTTYY